MKTTEIMKDLFSLAYKQDFDHTCDTCKAGDPEADVTKVAVTMFATPEVIRQAAKWGAQLLITHEPTYHTIPEDTFSSDKVDTEKRILLEGAGMVLFRFHDHPHFTSPDIISAGELEKMGLEGALEYTDIFDCVRIHLKTPMTPVELARSIERRLGIRHVRICGARDLPCQVVSGMFGAPGNIVLEELQRPESQIVLVGETCEWLIGEYARDAAQLGLKKALLIMGHVGSERDGMEYTARLLKERHPQLDVKYFDCGEVYTYTD